MKMAREKFKDNGIFLREKYSRFNTRIIDIDVYLIGQVPIKKMG